MTRSSKANDCTIAVNDDDGDLLPQYTFQTMHASTAISACITLHNPSFKNNPVKPNDFEYFLIVVHPPNFLAVHGIDQDTGMLKWLGKTEVPNGGGIKRIGSIGGWHVVVLLERPRSTIVVYSLADILDWISPDNNNPINHKKNVASLNPFATIQVTEDTWTKPADDPAPILTIGTEAIVVYVHFGVLRWIPILQSSEESVLLGPPCDVRLDEINILDVAFGPVVAISGHTNAVNTKRPISNSTTEETDEDEECLLILYIDQLDKRAVKAYKWFTESYTPLTAASLRRSRQAAALLSTTTASSLQSSPRKNSIGSGDGVNTVVTLSKVWNVQLMDPSTHRIIVLGKNLLVTIGYVYIQVLQENYIPGEACSYAFAQTKSMMLAQCLVDGEHAILGDAQGIIYWLSLEETGKKSGGKGLFKVRLRRMQMASESDHFSTPSCMAWLGGRLERKRLLFLGSHSGPSQLLALSTQKTNILELDESSLVPVCTVVDGIRDNLGQIVSVSKIKGLGGTERLSILGGSGGDSRLSTVQLGCLPGTIVPDSVLHLECDIQCDRIFPFKSNGHEYVIMTRQISTNQSPLSLAIDLISKQQGVGDDVTSTDDDLILYTFDDFKVTLGDVLHHSPSTIKQVLSVEGCSKDDNKRWAALVISEKGLGAIIAAPSAPSFVTIPEETVALSVHAEHGISLAMSDGRLGQILWDQTAGPNVNIVSTYKAPLVSVCWPWLVLLTGQLVHVPSGKSCTVESTSRLKYIADDRVLVVQRRGLALVSLKHDDGSVQCRPIHLKTAISDSFNPSCDLTFSDAFLSVNTSKTLNKKRQNLHVLKIYVLASSEEGAQYLFAANVDTASQQAILIQGAHPINQSDARQVDFEAGVASVLLKSSNPSSLNDAIAVLSTGTLGPEPFGRNIPLKPSSHLILYSLTNDNASSSGLVELDRFALNTINPILIENELGEEEEVFYGTCLTAFSHPQTQSQLVLVGGNYEPVPLSDHPLNTTESNMNLQDSNEHVDIVENPSGLPGGARLAAPVLLESSPQGGFLALFEITKSKLLLKQTIPTQHSSPTQVIHIPLSNNSVLIVVGVDDGNLLLFEHNGHCVVALRYNQHCVYPPGSINSLAGVTCLMHLGSFLPSQTNIGSCNNLVHYLLVGDLMRSVQVFQCYYDDNYTTHKNSNTAAKNNKVDGGEPQWRIQCIAQDSAFHWASAVSGIFRQKKRHNSDVAHEESVLCGHVLMADDCGNVLGFQMQIHPVCSDKDDGKLKQDNNIIKPLILKRSMAVHLGDQINAFTPCHSSHLSHLNNNDTDDASFYYFTIGGSIGRIDISTAGANDHNEKRAMNDSSNARSDMPAWRQFCDLRQAIEVAGQQVTFLPSQ